MRTLARVLRVVRVLGLALAGGALLLAVSCSDSNDDNLGSACHVVVDTCHAASSRGFCIEGLGALPSECVACIADHGCDYPTCQRSLTGCRIPEVLLPP